MVTRRAFIPGLVASTLLANRVIAVDPYFAVPTSELSPPGEVDPLRLFGTGTPTANEREKAAAIIQAAPTGPRPIDVAKYFLTDGVDPYYREQWPRNDAWNPVIVEFFKATNFEASNDMVAWCAAFVNWCLVQGHRRGTGSPSSQSFLNNPHFSISQKPGPGDLVVFSCHRVDDDVPIGLGHVGFLAEVPGATQMRVLGGNQSQGGHSSVISEATFPYVSAPFNRCVQSDGKGGCSMRTQVRLKKAAFLAIS